MTGQYQLHSAKEWLNENLHRNYPVIDDVVFQSTTGRTVPCNFIVDAHIVSLANVDSDPYSRFFISRISIAGNTANIEISYKPGSGSAFVCATVSSIPLTITAGDPVTDRTFSLVVSTANIPDEYYDMRYTTGTLIVGTCADISGAYSIDYEHGAILPTCITCPNLGVTGITVGDKVIAGNVTLIGGDGIDITVEQRVVSGVVEDTIIVTRVPTEAEKESPYSSTDNLYKYILDSLGNPIRSINGVEPDTSGNLTIIGDDCTQVTEGSHSITLSNPCSVPCCSTSQSEDITAAISELETAKTRLLEYYDALSNNVNLLQSKLASIISNKS